ncbi:uncharacterized protein J3D65DRAFT_438272 [Phyllosticta citribraziliensis]|uniref:Uncharacterized protein n=1 Tax=Phyllosticta citribraziliensis TaxID=989973 RepID=A0ABR1LK53_9PEZI
MTPEWKYLVHWPKQEAIRGHNRVKGRVVAEAVPSRKRRSGRGQPSACAGLARLARNGRELRGASDHHSAAAGICHFLTERWPSVPERWVRAKIHHVGQVFRAGACCKGNILCLLPRGAPRPRQWDDAGTTAHKHQSVESTRRRARSEGARAQGHGGRGGVRRGGLRCGVDGWMLLLLQRGLTSDETSRLADGPFPCNSLGQQGVEALARAIIILGRAAVATPRAGRAEGVSET